ncbi:hypothetical protein ACOTTU_24380 [Roseobacter sp. EG26]|uniref:hypothetical protein n=1 Tax=Roseobacter sp. EG26 TaxID=3412477 RepID=UPI003CE47150
MSKTNQAKRPNPLIHEQVHYRGDDLLDETLTFSLSKPDPSGSEFWTQVGSSALSASMIRRSMSICGYCGLKSRKYLQVLARNGREYDRASLRVACIFCSQVKTLDLVPVMRSGVLIRAPKTSQVELNIWARAIYVGRISQGPVAERARETLDKIMSLRDAAKAELGSEDPAHLAQQLRDRTEATAADLDAKLTGIRLFPLDRRLIREAELEFNQFPQILAYWRSKDGPFGGMTPPQWDLDTFTPLLSRDF